MGLLAGHYGIYRRCGDYALVPVFERTTAWARRRVIGLWEACHALPVDVNAEERAAQTLFIVTRGENEDEEAVAVATAYAGTPQHAGMAETPTGSLYFLRVFIRPGDRSQQLARAIVSGSYDYLNALETPDKPGGIAAIAQNNKLESAALRRAFRGIGWEVLGRDAVGSTVYGRAFT